MSTLTFPPTRLRSASCVAADIISTVEFNSSGELLATGDKGGRVVVFQREQEVRDAKNATLIMLPLLLRNGQLHISSKLDCLLIGICEKARNLEENIFKP